MKRSFDLKKQFICISQKDQINVLDYFEVNFWDWLRSSSLGIKVQKIVLLADHLSGSGFLTSKGGVISSLLCSMSRSTAYRKELTQESHPYLFLIKSFAHSKGLFLLQDYQYWCYSECLIQNNTKLKQNITIWVLQS